MKKNEKKILLAVLVFMLALVGCGEDKNTESAEISEKSDIITTQSMLDTENKGNFDPERIQQELKKEVKAKELSEEHLREVDEAFVNSEEFNPIYRNARFLVNGISVHIPYTARGFEKLFDTKFVYVTGVQDNGRNEKIRFYDANYNFIQVMYNETFEYVDKSSLTLDELLDLPIQDFEFGTWQFFPQMYESGHPKDMTDLVDTDKHSFFAIYNIVFQNPDEIDSGILTTDGIGFSFAPACFQSFREYITGTLPRECYADGVKNFSEYFSESDDWDYYLDEDAKPLRCCVGDVTCDGIEELAIIENDSTLDIYAYDKDDMCIRKIWTGQSNEEECKIDKGTLAFYNRINQSATQEMGREDIEYYVLDTKGNVILNSNLNMKERTVHVNTKNEEENEYDGEWYINGCLVSRKDYMETRELFSIKYDHHCFYEFEEDYNSEKSESICMSSLNNLIGVYNNHNAYKEFVRESDERRASLKLDGDINISEELSERFAKSSEAEYPQLTDDISESSDSNEWAEVYKDHLYRVINGQECLPDLLDAVTYTPDMGVRFALMDITGDGIPELFLSEMPYEDRSPIEYWHFYTIEDGKESFMGEISYFNPDNNLIYVSNGTSFESYEVYKLSDGLMKTEYEVSEGDVEGQETPYYIRYGEGDFTGISEQEMESFRKEYESGLEKYAIEGILLTEDNVDRIEEAVVVEHPTEEASIGAAIESPMDADGKPEASKESTEP